MSNFTFENQGANTYLVYQIKEEDSLDSMSLGMLTNNRIPGLASAMFTQMDAAKYIKYNVSSRVSVSQFFSGAVNRKRLLEVFSGIVDALLSAEDYMIDERMIILDLDYIFADVSSCETVLICLPVDQEAQEHDLGAFFKEIMFSTQFDQTENCDHVAHIINYLNSTPVFALDEFKNILEKEKSAPANSPAAAPVAQKPASPARDSVSGRTPAPQPAVHQAPPPQTAPRQTVPQPAVQQTAPPQTAPRQTAPRPAATEKKISMLGLLMHYSKENAELYRQQKAEKKAAKKADKPAPKKGKKSPAQPGQPSSPQTAAPGSVPPQGFAIPGQATPEIQPVARQNPAAAPAQPSVQPAAAPAQPSVQPAAAPIQPACVPGQTPQGQAANFGETTVLGSAAIGETTVLNAANNPAQMIAPHLIRKKNNEKISLNKPVFRIGKERSYVDYFIGDNTAISRSHVNIITREGAYFIVDTNSTNHTFVNGTMINSSEEVQINHGDTVRLANEDFDFKLY